MYTSPVESYYQSNCYHHQIVRKLIKQLNLQGNERILDIGCGDGRITAEIATCVPNGSVLGIDPSQQMIAFAKTKFPENIYHNLSFKSGDAQDLNFTNEFDVVVSFGTLHILVDHIPILLGIYNSLKKNGKVILQLTSKGRDNAESSVIFNLLKNQKWKYLEKTVVYGFYNEDQYRQWLEKSGFVTEKVEIHNSYGIYQNLETFDQTLRGNWFSLSSRIPANLYQDFISEFIEKYLAINPPNQDGTINFHEDWLLVEARKIK
ncbi:MULTISPECIES: class I SAM-dependent methyltransferase [unclassified Nodularia (in: cyanobacteria)]|uniref:class I SAM-dependent methyltransferase n=1 Tax=unclassified Nodularia (in: cyanobacteria) TaxID=2656917 RepID=UPI001882BD32|nr:MULTISPECIES: class I SAM-dependent methyltransferase [unclassified Nodularia (in: cyanobacteria)]MBE9200826.1 class I SAM-dependent methyltransferase [Nodularia sp. LEGE 06071]MCC2695560.1 class I SAM-dependent methyltransferase [Nodularia sp. LEGE 04288]